jgi:hypothetical protein
MNVFNLITQGYAVVSRKFCIVSRIDRYDWREYCEENKYPISADWYRRVLSKDRLVVNKSIIHKIPNSCHADYYYRNRENN